MQYGRFSNELYADDLVVVADCKHDLQVSCDVVAAWARKWRFKFGVGPTKSAAMVFGQARLVPICAVTLAGFLSHRFPSILPRRHSHVFPHLGSPHSQTDCARQSPLRPVRVLNICLWFSRQTSSTLTCCRVCCGVQNSVLGQFPRCGSKTEQYDVGAAVCVRGLT